MILKSLIFCCAISSIWTRAAKCQNDVSPEMRESNMRRPSGQGFESVHRRFANDRDIDHVKLMLKNANEMSAKDYEKFRFMPRDSDLLHDSRKSNVNVNVMHHDPSQSWGNKKNSNQSNRRPSRKQHDIHQERLNRILQMIHTMPNSNIDYNLAHPHGNMNIQKGKDSKLETSPIYSNTHQRIRFSDDSDESFSSEYNNDKCHPIVNEALEYLKSVKIRLSSLEESLRLLIRQPQLVDSFEDSDEL